MEYDHQLQHNKTEMNKDKITKTIVRNSRFLVSVIALSLIVFTLCFLSFDKQVSKAQTLTANISVVYHDSIDSGVYVTKVDQPIIFDGTGSSGYGAFSIEPYEWDFGDGFKAKIIRATHTFRTAGTYTVSLTVKNAANQTNTATVSVRVDEIAAPSQKLCVGTVSESGCSSTTYTTIQDAVDAAATMNGSGTVDVVLPAGATFTESVNLVVPSGNHYITIRSDKVKNLPKGRRTDRTDLSNFTTIKTKRVGAFLGVSTILALNANGTPTHHYRLQGLQFRMAEAPVRLTHALVALGLNSDNTPCDPNAGNPDCLPQTTEERVPHHFIIDRCLFYNDEAYAEEDFEYCLKRGLEVNARVVSLLDSNFSNLNCVGLEAKAIGVLNGTKAFSMINNHLEAGVIQILFGGEEPKIANSFTTDVEFRRNRSHKPPEKRNLPSTRAWSSKNNFEIKAGQYFVIEGNVFDYNWRGWDQQDATVGFVANTLDSGSWAITKDIQFTKNKILQGTGGLGIGRTGTVVSGEDRLSRHLIKDNLIEDLGSAYDGRGRALSITVIPSNLVVRHNTLLRYEVMTWLDGPLQNPITYENNVGPAPGNPRGIAGTGTADGNTTLNTYAPGSTVVRNVFAGANSTNYPSNNYFTPTSIAQHFVGYDDRNYRLASDSPVQLNENCTGSPLDCNDGGANPDALRAATAGSVTGLWSNPTAADFDGDGKTDHSVWRPSTGVWYAWRSSNSTLYATTWGTNGDVIMPGDYDGDGKTDPAVFRPSTNVWYILRSSDSVNVVESFGSSGDVPVAADYDGDGKTDIAVYRPSTTQWHMYYSGYSVADSYHVITFGGSTDIPAHGDYDGDGKFDQALYRSSNNTWYILRSSNGTSYSQQWGASGDLLAQGKYDGDSKTDIAIFRPSAGAWYISRSYDGTARIDSFGTSGDSPVVGDYDNDGFADMAIFRPSTTTWWVWQSSVNSSMSLSFGNSTDVLVPAAYFQ